MKLPKIKIPVRDLASKAAPVVIGLLAAWAQRKIGRAADKVSARLK